MINLSFDPIRTKIEKLTMGEYYSIFNNINRSGERGISPLFLIKVVTD
jgi:hypothetical protein